MGLRLCVFQRAHSTSHDLWFSFLRVSFLVSFKTFRWHKLNPTWCSRRKTTSSSSECVFIPLSAFFSHRIPSTDIIHQFRYLSEFPLRFPPLRNTLYRFSLHRVLCTFKSVVQSVFHLEERRMSLQGQWKVLKRSVLGKTIKVLKWKSCIKMLFKYKITLG